MKAFHILSVFICLLILLGCSTMQIENQSLQREWKLVEMNHYKKEDFIQRDLTLNLSSLQLNKIQSKCLNSEVLVYQKSNLMKIELKLKNDGLKNYSCSEIERVFVQTIMDTESYEVKGHFLTLNLKGNKTLKFIAADWD